MTQRRLHSPLRANLAIEVEGSRQRRGTYGTVKPHPGGPPGSVAMNLTGHETRSVFERYNVTSPADFKNAAAMFNTFHNVMGANRGPTIRRVTIT
ncbi:MAG: hypothetical protein O3A53_04530 [Acidobacteria bacterium]|nr:hypothetical protein [Acidobacteriota bacterium]MDA1234047.1 hypothetical protein [Acidobacteriota bacterium]